MLCKSVCFIGDSITEGTKNGGYGWYMPILRLIPSNIEIENFSKGAMTSKYFLENAQRIADKQCGLYIVAFGCNDIRYREQSICAMDSEQYIENIDNMVNIIKTKNQKSKFVFIAPWMSLSYDPFFKGKDHEDKVSLYESYTDALKDYCREKDFIFIDPNPLIFDNIKTPDITTKNYLPEEILVDHIHPNSTKGLWVYCAAVLNALELD